MKIQESWKKIKRSILSLTLSKAKRLEETPSVAKQIDHGAVKSEITESDSQSLTETEITFNAVEVTGNPLISGIQSYLKIMGFPMGNSGPNKNGVDGKLGEITRSAVKTFQALTGLNVTGECDNNLMLILREMVVAGETMRNLALKADQAGINLEINRESSRPDFVNTVYYHAISDETQSKVPAAVTTTQAILESGYGKYVPVDLETKRYSYNLFGIKGVGPAGSVNCWTKEENKQTGVWEPVISGFRAFYSFSDSIKGHSDFFYQNLSRYGEAFKTANPADFAREIAKAGYATDSRYARKLIYLMRFWGLIS